MQTLSLADFMKLRRLVYRGARPLEFTMWKCAFESGGYDDFLDVVASYQNADGGFGHNIEANNWNPNSSPYVTDCAIGQMGRAGGLPDRDHPVVRGIIKYLASGEHCTLDGWAVGIPSNNDYSHAPWFHYDPQRGEEANAGLTNSLSDFILKYADAGSGIYQKAAAFHERYKPAAPQAVPDFSNYDPSKYEPWMPMPTDFAKSPDSENYPALKNIIDMQLDAMAGRLKNMDELPVMHEKEIKEWDERVPRADGQPWHDSEQIIGSYYWGCSDIISQIEILNRFGRLEFQLPYIK